VLLGKQLSLNVSNTKVVSFGLTVQRQTSKIRTRDSELNSDFDYVLKIIDTKYSSCISIFGDELQSFFLNLGKIFKNQHLSFETEFYVIKAIPDGFFECQHKSGQKIYRIARNSMELLLQMKDTIEDHFASLGRENYLRTFFDILNTFLKLEENMKCRFDSTKFIYDNISIFDNESNPTKMICRDFCYTYPKTIIQMLEYIKSLN
jgi:hypothetical protein